jgi:adenylate cyclase
MTIEDTESAYEVESEYWWAFEQEAEGESYAWLVSIRGPRYVSLHLGFSRKLQLYTHLSARGGPGKVLIVPKKRYDKRSMRPRGKKKVTKKKRRKASPSTKRKLAAVMFTDMTGYTALGQRNEYLSLALVNEHRRLLRPIFNRHNGREIKTIGDAFLVEFESALDATRCAYDIQRTVREYNISLPAGNRFALRVGVHVGDVIESKDGDISGDTVNVASRIEPLAGDGGVCITRQVYDNVENKFDLPFESLGPKSLKNVKNQVEVYKLVMPWEHHVSKERKMVTSEELNSDQIQNQLLDPRRIAVLPFSNMSPEPSDEYFAEGMTEELISAISKIGHLEVIARTSVLPYKKADKRVDEIGKELNVGTVLEGSVRKVGQKLRITAQLIDSRDSKHLWSETYDRELKDVFTIQSEISQTVANALRIRLVPSERERIGRAPTKDLEAYTLYMRGLFQQSKVTNQGINESIRYFERARERDSEFATAYSALSYSYWLLGWFDFAPSKEVFPKAKDYANKALSIDDGLAEAHLSLAWILADYDWDSSSAEREYRRAIELNPNLPMAHIGLSHLESHMGNRNEALAEAKRTYELDPLSAFSTALAGTQMLYNEHTDEAIEFLKKALEVDSNITLAQDNLGLAYIRKRDYEKGLRLIEDSVRSSGPTDTGKLQDLAYAYSQAGMIDRAKDILTKILDLREKKQCPAIAVAGVYSCLGEIDRSYEWLEKAIEERDSYVRAVGRDFVFDNIRSDPRYPGLLHKIGLSSPEEAAKTEGELLAKHDSAISFDRKRIAILPFANISPDPKDEYFADGLTEELISKISLISELSVISRTSAINYKNSQSKKVLDIGNELKAGTLLEGTVRKAGNRVRISAQLIDVATDQHLWSETYDQTIEDVFRIQSEIADSVASALRIKLLASGKERINKSSTANVEAYILYLKGRACPRTKEGLERSIEYNKQAIEKDPGYAPAYAAIAGALIEIGFREYKPAMEAFREAKKFAEKALEIDPDLPEAHLSLASVTRNLDWDYPAAEREYRKVIDLNPNLAAAHSRLAILICQLGRVDEALKEVMRAVELDPVSPKAYADAGMVFLYARQYQKALSLLNEARDLDPNTWGLHNLGLTLVQMGRVEEGIKLIESHNSKSPETQMELAYAYAKIGKQDDARQILGELIQGSKQSPGWSAAVAGVYASLGEKDPALDWLEKAYEAHSGFLKGHLRTDFVFDPLRSEPRFIALLKKMNLLSPEEAAAAERNAPKDPR